MRSHFLYVIDAYRHGHHSKFPRTPSWISSFYKLVGVTDSTNRNKDILFSSPVYLLAVYGSPDSTTIHACKSVVRLCGEGSRL